MRRNGDRQGGGPERRSSNRGDRNGDETEPRLPRDQLRALSTAETASRSAQLPWSKLRGNVEEDCELCHRLDTPLINGPSTRIRAEQPAGDLGRDCATAPHRGITICRQGRGFNSRAGAVPLALSYWPRPDDVRGGTSTGPAKRRGDPGYVTAPSSVTYYFSDRGGFRSTPSLHRPGGNGMRRRSRRALLLEGDILTCCEQGLEDTASSTNRAHPPTDIVYPAGTTNAVCP